MNYKDYYKTLGISKSASQDEIKKAYRKMAVRYHPDKNPGDASAEQKFKNISEAYEVLKDPDTREKYDRLGANWKQYERGGAGSDAGGSYRRYDYGPRQEGDGFKDFFGSFGGSGFSDFFEQFFGSGFSRGGQQQGFTDSAYQRGHTQRKRTAQNLSGTVYISLEDAFHGTKRILNSQGERFRISIPKGVKDKQTLRLKGKGAKDPQTGIQGDLLLTIRINPHPFMKRINNNLETTMYVNALTAILGGSVQVNTLEGKKQINIPEGTDNGKIFRLKGLGMPESNSGKRGDLHVKINITIPKNLNSKQKEMLRKCRDELKGKK